MKLSLKRDIDLYTGQVLIWLFIPIAKLFGLILQRDHGQVIKGDTLIIKMAGGGSLVIAYPSLLALKKNTHHKLSILCSKGVAPFAKSLSLFDEVIIIEDTSLVSFARDYFSFFIRYQRSFDTVINLEVHSRLATLISLFTMARNRVGFHRHSFNHFNSLNTHSYYFNLHTSIPSSYDSIYKAYAFDSLDEKSIRTQFKESLSVHFPIDPYRESDHYYIGIGAVCSDLALERMMPSDAWLNFAKYRIKEIKKPIKIFLYGAPEDTKYYEKMIDEVFEHLDSQIQVENAAGFKPLAETVHHMSFLDEYWGIDTSLLHYARLLGLKTYSFWGATNPNVYLRKFNELDEKFYYKGIECSPCVHHSRYPPCKGNNICMNYKF